MKSRVTRAEYIAMLSLVMLALALVIAGCVTGGVKADRPYREPREPRHSRDI